MEYEVLTGGGESGALMRAVDWSSTAVGPVSSWPQSLRTAISILLDNSFGMAVAWGPEYIFFYNDAYRPILGSTKHPAAMGRPITKVFPEIWHIIGPMFEDVMRGKNFGWDDWRLPLDRHGFTEECFFTFSYSPIRDESGGVGGVLVTVTEITARVLGERRLRIVRDVAARTAEARSDDEACRIAVAVLANETWDLPFASLYLIDGEDRPPRLVAHCGSSDAASADAWPIDEALRHRTAITVDRIDIPHKDDFGETRVREAIVLPIGRYGALIAGISPRLRFDESYRNFLDLAANQIAIAVGNTRAYREAKERADSLAELDRAKTIFFSNVSHEFRTPLTLLLGPLEDMLQREHISPEDRKALDIAHRNALRLLKLVNTLLEFSRIEAGRIDASYEPVDLAQYTEELAATFRSAIEAAGLQFTVRCDRIAEPVYVDRAMWEMIVLNLISNAFKFTFDGGIEVALRRHGGEVELSVRDSGVGIPEHELPNMFRRFHRVRDARSRSHEGTGIGLALVQELARLHGGRVSVDSKVDSGSVFSVRVPLGIAHLPPDRISAPRHETRTVAARTFLDTVGEWVPETRGAAPSPERILVVDDNADMRTYLAHLLAAHWNVETATDGVAALEIMRRRRPDLVLSDIMMPRMDGFGLLREIRDDKTLRDVPVIMVSARAGNEAQVQGLDAGADDYLIKPFSAPELVARVRSHLALAKMRRESAERVTRILESITDAFAFLDRAWTIRMLNSKAVEIIGRTAAELQGAQVWNTFPELAGTTFESAIRNALQTGEPQRVEDFYPPFGKWIEVNVYPSDDGLSCFFRDVSDRVLTARTLRENEHRYRDLAAQLEIANRAKDEFLTTLSHELRTPMTATLGWATLLRLGAAEDEWHKAIDAIERSTRAQAKLIDDILDVSRISTGKLQLVVEPVALERIVENVVATFHQLAAVKSQTIEAHIDKLQGCVIGDGHRLAQIVRNLLSNAVKFTASGGRIRIELTQADDRTARIRVTDTGSGIAPDFLPYVFERFRQAETGFTRTHGGLGIGLSIVKDLTELHGGRVIAESDGPGKGSSFTVFLPLVVHDALPQTIDNGKNQIRALDGIPVLVVEDDEATRLMLHTALSKFGATVSTAGSVAEALVILAKERHSVVISDISMPGEDGYSLLSRLHARADGDRRHYTIALTANARGEDRDKALSAGFDSFLTKPVDLKELADEVHRLAHLT